MPAMAPEQPTTGSAAKPPEGGLLRIKAELKEVYSKGAARYDAERSVNRRAECFFKEVYGAVDEWIGPTHAATVHVDMPVGTGRFLFYLRDRGRRHRMIGIDIAPGMLAVCRKKAEVRGDALALSFGDAFALPLPDGSVDVLTSLRFFHLFPKRYWPVLLAEMRRVLKPGGFLIIEMRNLFRGLAGGIVKEYRDRWLRRDQPHSFIWPHQVGGYFADWDEVRSRGAGLDGLDLLAATAPNWLRRAREMARFAPLRYVTKELLVKAHKPRS